MKTRTFVFLVLATLLALVTVTSCAKSPSAPGGGGGTGGGGSLFDLAPFPGTSRYDIPIPGTEEVMRIAITRYTPIDKNAFVAVGETVTAEIQAVGMAPRTVFIFHGWREEGQPERDRCTVYGNGGGTFFLNRRPEGNMQGSVFTVRENTRNIIGFTLMVFFKNEFPAPFGDCADFLVEESFNYRTPAGSR